MFYIFTNLCDESDGLFVEGTSNFISGMLFIELQKINDYVLTLLSNNKMGCETNDFIVFWEIWIQTSWYLLLSVICYNEYLNVYAMFTTVAAAQKDWCN